MVAPTKKKKKNNSGKLSPKRSATTNSKTNKLHGISEGTDLQIGRAQNMTKIIFPLLSAYC